MRKDQILSGVTVALSALAVLGFLSFWPARAADDDDDAITSTIQCLQPAPFPVDMAGLPITIPADVDCYDLETDMDADET